MSKDGKKKKEWIGRPIPELLWELKKEIEALRVDVSALSIRREIRSAKPEKELVPFEMTFKGMGPGGEDQVLEFGGEKKKD